MKVSQGIGLGLSALFAAATVVCTPAAAQQPPAPQPPPQQQTAEAQHPLHHGR